MSNQNEVFGAKLQDLFEGLQALDIAHRESLAQAHTQRDYANDAAEKGDEARLNAGAMELRITELEAQLSEAIWLLKESREMAPDTAYWPRLSQFMAAHGAEEPRVSIPILGYLDGHYQQVLASRGQTLIFAKKADAMSPVPVMLAPNGKERN